MSNIFKEVLSMSLSGATLILLLFLLKPVLKERFSKAWQYYIWIIVLIRLLLPFSPEYGIVDNLFQEISLQESAASQPEAVTIMTPVKGNSDITDSEGTKGNPSISIVTARDKKLPDIWQIAGSIWLCGILLLLSGKSIKYIRFIRLLRSSSEPVADKRIIEIYRKAAEELGIHKRPMLRINGIITTPMVTEVTKPVVYLSNNTAGWEEKSLYYVLRHELMHYKRHDLLYKLCCDIILCIHWFNPLVYIMLRQINRQCEISCDEAVTRNLSKQEKLEYGNVLLNAAAENKYPPMMSNALFEDKRNMKERIKTIIMSKPKSKKTLLVSGLVTLILCLAAFWLGAYTMNNKYITNKADAAGSHSSTESNSGAPENGANPGSEIDTRNENQSNDTNSDTKSNENQTSSSAQVGTDNEVQKDAQGDTPPGKASNSNAGAISGSTSQSGATQATTDKAQEDTKDSEAALSDKSITYSNTDYGFELLLPSGWKGYEVMEDTWEGRDLSGKKAGEITESGAKLIIRHPEWTEENPRQDIPIMIFTFEQWERVTAEEIGVSAAPVGPYKLGGNSKYIFALPPRYNFAFNTGYEEVDKIVKSSAFKVND
jgi:beta-lactamase regulating signal transducer with metallopeptidase domain